MKRSVIVVFSILFAAALVSPALAKPGKGKGNGGGGGGGGEPQSGGLPALEDRVDADEALIATLQTQVSTLMSEVTALQGAVGVLQGQNNFAVVSPACAVVSSSSNAGPVTSTPVATGECEVTFSEDVSACAAQATLINSFGEITVASATKVSVGDSFDVFTDVPAGTPAAAGFNLTVTCP